MKLWSPSRSNNETGAGLVCFQQKHHYGTFTHAFSMESTGQLTRLQSQFASARIVCHFLIESMQDVCLGEAMRELYDIREFHRELAGTIPTLDTPAKVFKAENIRTVTAPAITFEEG